MKILHIKEKIDINLDKDNAARFLSLILLELSGSLLLAQL